MAIHMKDEPFCKGAKCSNEETDEKSIKNGDITEEHLEKILYRKDFFPVYWGEMLELLEDLINDMSIGYQHFYVRELRNSIFISSTGMIPTSPYFGDNRGEWASRGRSRC
ncbi:MULTISPECIES: hypothetical protein [unclassified Lysinibacillus]|uniref:hypothetical protein n=1 Tax=unclassified Lysinibacillus TaxID=2636778 RepID=UPI0037F87EB4